MPHCVPESRCGAPRRYKDRGALAVCAYNGTWAGKSSRCEDPAPTVGICGDSVAMHRHRPSFATTWASTGTANGRVATRHAASLRPLRNGGIGFKPPYSKRETATKGPAGVQLGGFSLLTGKEVSIKKIHFSKNVATRHLCGFAEENPISGEIAHYVSVGEVPSVASALPYQRGVIKTVGSP